VKLSLLVVGISLIFNSSLEAKELKAKTNWKTFQSDYGYEFKYPDCWEISIEDSDYTGPLEKADGILLKQSEKCTNKDFQSDGTGISILIHNRFESKEKSITAISEKEAWFKNISKTNYKLLMKDHKSENSYSYFEVEQLYQNPKSPLKIRWNMYLFCPLFEINFSGPLLEEPDTSYLEKFKKGDLGLPEPEKTIYESIRCIKTKVKGKPKK
jgi:hypothetical protein